MSQDGTHGDHWAEFKKMIENIGVDEMAVFVLYHHRGSVGVCKPYFKATMQFAGATGTFDTSSEVGMISQQLKLIPGEAILMSHNGVDSFYFLTSYRIGVVLRDRFFITAIGLIYDMEVSQTNNLLIRFKHGKTTLFPFDKSEVAAHWEHAIFQLVEDNVGSITSGFAFTHKLRSKPFLTSSVHNDLTDSVSNVVFEFKRLGFDESNLFRIEEVNPDFKICNSYPTTHIVPIQCKSSDYMGSALFRKKGRFPSITWRNVKNGAILMRSSQPRVGFLNNRSPEDEALVRAATTRSVDEGSLIVGDAGMIILDARSKVASIANCAAGGGYESSAYYGNCHVIFAQMGNIHRVRTIFYDLSRSLFANKLSTNPRSGATDDCRSQYLKELSLLLSAALQVARYLEAGVSVLVHCSDGWDRTSQICSVAKLFLDPYYRTIRGFLLLVQRDWIEYGHPFRSRCFHTARTSTESSPAFVFFIDAVHQVMMQHPSHFQFNEPLLHKLIEHAYSGIFGTFLCDSLLQRRYNCVDLHTCGLWDFVLHNNQFFENWNYSLPSMNSVELIVPHCDEMSLAVWHELFSTDNLFFDILPTKRHDTCERGEVTDKLALESLITDAMEDCIACKDDLSSPSKKDTRSVTPLFSDSRLTPVASSLEEAQRSESESCLLGFLNSSLTCDQGCEDYILVSPPKPPRDQTKSFLDQDSLYKFKKFGTLPFCIKSKANVILSDGLTTNCISQFGKVCAMLTWAAKRDGLLNIKLRGGDVHSRRNHATPDSKSPASSYLDTDDDCLSFSFADDNDWEVVKSQDSSITKWLPDHFASRCLGCGTLFGFLVRRHHCRRCGMIFCHKCCSKREIVSKELLFIPSRVCTPCHQMIVRFESPGCKS